MISLTRPSGSWTVYVPHDKLAVRAALPGAFGFDQAVHAVRVARARGVAPEDLVSLAMPTSWMVNNKAPSTVFQRWLKAPLADVWGALIELLSCGYERFPELDATSREAITAGVRALSIDGQGAAAVSKVLAIVCPETVPLMDDAALWFALGAPAAPTTADAPTADAASVVPMLDWFSREVTAHTADLIDLARGHGAAVLDAPQVLDRLLWMESWGWRILRSPAPTATRWFHVQDGTREGILPLGGPHPEVALASPLARHTLGDFEDSHWRRAAREALADID